MATSDGRVTLSAAVPVEMKERLQKIAAERRWTLSQAVLAFLEDKLSDWETELGINTQPSPPTTEKKRKSPKR